MTISLAITGASGSIGRMIVPRLADAGIRLVLAGRDPDRLHALFPGLDAVGYDGLPDALRGCDAVLHLAVLNNDRSASPDAFRAVNVDFLLHVADMARTAAVPLFINAATVRALDRRASDPYTATKREGEAALGGIEGLHCVNLRMPAVYGGRFTGRLSALNHLPPSMRGPALAAAAAFRPVVHADRVAGAIVALLDEAEEPDVIVADPPEDNAVCRAGKRCMDIAFVAVVALLFWWLLAIAWIAVKLGSPGPGLFAQPRVGEKRTRLHLLQISHHADRCAAGRHARGSGRAHHVARTFSAQHEDR